MSKEQFENTFRMLKIETNSITQEQCLQIVGDALISMSTQKQIMQNMLENASKKFEDLQNQNKQFQRLYEKHKAQEMGQMARGDKYHNENVLLRQDVERMEAECRNLRMRNDRLHKEMKEMLERITHHTNSYRDLQSERDDLLAQLQVNEKKLKTRTQFMDANKKFLEVQDSLVKQNDKLDGIYSLLSSVANK